MQDRSTVVAEVSVGQAVAERRPALEVRNLSVRYETPEGTVEAVRDVSLAIERGETVGVVGESGCGKSSLALAAMGYLGSRGRATGEVLLAGENLLTKSTAELRQIRGSRLAIVYQDPLSTLNPSMVVGEQIAEVYRLHRGASREVAWQRAIEMLGKVGIGDPGAAARRFPHQLSGGMQQRVVIAMALCCDPDVLIMDEPTTALDVTTEARVLDLVSTLQREFGSAILYISHNLGVVAQVCDRVAVMYAGEVVETSAIRETFQHPLHPYSVGLLNCVPRLGVDKSSTSLQPIPGRLPDRRHRLEGCAFASRCQLARQVCRTERPALEEARPGHLARCHFWRETATQLSVLSSGRSKAAPDRPETTKPADCPAVPTVDTSTEGEKPGLLLEVKNLTKHFGGDVGLGSSIAKLLGRLPRPVRAVDGVSFEVAPGQTLALVGESGCGKTTLGRSVAGLTRITDGRITFDGEDVSEPVRKRRPDLRRQIQMVFQNPEASLNPRQTIGYALERPLRRFRGLDGKAARKGVGELLRSVNLDPSYADRYPRQLSGGEKQRIAIARAFAGDPRLVVLDEPVSALDVSVQATVLNLLIELQRELGTSYVLISHDLSVVRYVADWIGVVYLGRLCEIGPADTLFAAPHHPYTEALLSAVPDPDPDAQRERIRLDGVVPSPRTPPRGCAFHTRCLRKLGEVCVTTPPPARRLGDGHTIHCHIPPDRLKELQEGE